MFLGQVSAFVNVALGVIHAKIKCYNDTDAQVATCNDDIDEVLTGPKLSLYEFTKGFLFFIFLLFFSFFNFFPPYLQEKMSEPRETDNTNLLSDQAGGREQSGLPTASRTRTVCYGKVGSRVGKWPRISCKQGLITDTSLGRTKTRIAWKREEGRKEGRKRRGLKQI